MKEMGIQDIGDVVVNYPLCIGSVRAQGKGEMYIVKTDLTMGFFLLSEPPIKVDVVKRKMGNFREGYDRWRFYIMDHETEREASIVVDILCVGDDLVDVVFPEKNLYDNIRNLVEAVEIQLP